MKTSSSSEMDCSDTQDQSIEEPYAQLELLKEEQAHRIYELKENFLQQIEDLKGVIQVLRSENEEEKASQEKALTELMEKHAKKLKDQEHKHEEEMSKMFKKHDELEQKILTMQENCEEKLCKQEDDHFQTTINTKQVYDDRLQELKAKVEEMDNSQETIQELKQKLKLQEEVLYTAKKKVKNMEIQIQKLTADIKTCSSYVKYPHLLRENFIKLELHKPVRVRVNAGVGKKELLQMTAVSQKQSRATKTNCSMTLEQQAKVQLKGKKSAETQRMMKKKNVAAVDRRNKETMDDLRRKLITKEKELGEERQRVRNINSVVERMKADIKTCSDFIQQPKWLKENIKKLHKCYIHEADGGFRAMTGVVQDNLQRMRVSQKKSHMEAEIQKTDLLRHGHEEISILSKESMIDLKQMLKMKEKELGEERHRVRDMTSLVDRMKADIKSCSGFIHQPNLLKEKMIKLHNSYILEADVKVGVKYKVVQQAEGGGGIPGAKLGYGGHNYASSMLLNL